MVKEIEALCDFIIEEITKLLIASIIVDTFLIYKFKSKFISLAKKRSVVYCEDYHTISLYESYDNIVT